MKKTDDLEYFQECLEAEFFLYKEKLLVSSIVHIPSNQALSKLFAKYSLYEVEKYLNHFHMCFISDDLEIQKNCAIQIWETWRKFFHKKFSNEQIEIQLADTGSEIILTVHRLNL